MSSKRKFIFTEDAYITQGQLHTLITIQQQHVMSFAHNGGSHIFSLPVLTLIFPALLPCLVLRDSLCTDLQTKRLWI